MISEIKYSFIFSDNSNIEYTVPLGQEASDISNSQNKQIPNWANLDFNKCSHCPLNIQEYPHCPLALKLVDLNDRFNNIPSYADINLEVQAQSRTITQKTTAQQGLCSLMGLVIANSGCPYTDFFKPMAQFHLPLANEQETIFRATAVYFQSCYFINKNKGNMNINLEPLSKIYENVSIMNSFIAKRLRKASKEDSAPNALVLLDLFAKAMPYVIEDGLEELKPVLEPAIQYISEI